MTKFRLFIFMFLFSVQASIHAADETKYYDVELVVFENLETNPVETEIWPTDINMPIPENSIYLNEPSILPALEPYQPEYSFKTLPWSEYQLKREVKSLKDSNNHRVLLHTLWRQPGMEQSIAPVIIFDHNILPPDPALNMTDQHAATHATEAQESEQQSESVNADINPFAQLVTLPEGYTGEYGNLKLQLKVLLARYLHIEVNMAYRKNMNAAPVNLFDTQYIDTQEKRPVVYHLKERRRMRSNELHYLDHPVVSAIIIIRPFVPPKELAPVPVEISPDIKPAGIIKR